MSVALSIAFTGLCALVADGRGGEVLLVNTTGIGTVEGMVLPPHAATLVMDLAELANPEGSFPDRVVMAQGGGQLGIWDLSGSEVRIRTQSETAEALRLFQPSPAESSWPETPQDVNDPRAWRDPRFLADLGLIVADGRIDPGLLSGGAPDRGGLPSTVSARIRLEGGLIEGGLPSQPSYRGERFEFRSSHGVIRQPVTDTMRWTLDSPSAAVVIEIVPVQGGAPRRLLLAASSTPHQAFVSNLPAEARHESGLHGMSEDEMAALHFAAYYKLLKSEPAARPLPRLLSQAEAAGTGFIRPSTCPPAIFRRE